MDREVWHAVVHAVMKSWTQLGDDFQQKLESGESFGGMICIKKTALCSLSASP